MVARESAQYTKVQSLVHTLERENAFRPSQVCVYGRLYTLDSTKSITLMLHSTIKKVFFLDQRVVYLIKFNNDRNIYDTSPDVSLF